MKGGGGFGVGSTTEYSGRSEGYCAWEKREENGGGAWDGGFAVESGGELL